MGKYFDNGFICYDVCNKHIAQGALTNSKRPSSFIEGVYPTHVHNGKGCFLFDVDGNRYLDYLCGLGTNLFGYANPKIILAIQNEVLNGVSHSLGTDLEVYFAMKIKNKFPHLEKIKVLKSGSEGCSAAIRIARSYTGNKIVVSEGYHGWHDDFVSMTEPAYGVPQRSYMVRYKDGMNLSHCAAVIIEPVVLDCSTERRIFLEKLREDCTRDDCLLIFDETITAYRFPSYSVASYWGIEPDISIQGKALANGMPISVVGGKAKIMDSEYFVSSTYAGENLTLASAVECINLISGEYPPERLWDSGSEFTEEFNAACEPLGLFIEGYPTRGSFVGNTNLKALFFQEMLKAGVFMHPKTWFYNQDLHQYKDMVCKLAAEVCRKILAGQVYLQGSLPKSPYEKR